MGTDDHDLAQLEIDLVVLCYRLQRETGGDPKQVQPSTHDLELANAIRRDAYVESTHRDSQLLGSRRRYDEYPKRKSLSRLE